jgi:hypothetical protein
MKHSEPPLFGKARFPTALLSRGRGRTVALIAATGSLFSWGFGQTSIDFFDRLDRALTFQSDDRTIRGHVSGTVDLEAYRVDQPAPGLIFTEHDSLITPRLTVSFDAQVGPTIYVFAQARADRRFDPADHGFQLRLDEWAIRYTPHKDGRFNVQLGKFATVVGNWVGRHGSWRDPFITAPLPYENLMGIWDVAPAAPGSKLLKWAHIAPPSSPAEELADKDRRLPIIWGPSYTTGAAVTGRIAAIDYALEFKNGSLSARPSTWSPFHTAWRDPTVSGRLGYRPNPMWNFGASASVGHYLQPPTDSMYYGYYGMNEYQEIVVAQDLAFAWHHFQLWAEVFTARFTIPEADDAQTIAYYVEAKYKFAPQFFAAVRWNHQLFGRIHNAAGGLQAWGREQERIDFAPTYRFSPNTQLKFQYSVLHETQRATDFSQTIALQFTVRF